MSRIASVTRLARQLSRIKVERVQPLSYSHNAVLNSAITRQKSEESMGFVESRNINQSIHQNQIKGRQKSEESMGFVKGRNINHSIHQNQIKGVEIVPGCQIGENIPRKDKIMFLVTTLMDIHDSKEAVYSCLDSWVAWERDFPIGALKNVLLDLEKYQQWHRVIQVIKWMLSKGQGTTNGTYGQLIHALDMDQRVEEAQEIWKKKLAFDLHSVPWKVCNIMISIYYRNKMLRELVELFEGLEGYGRKPPEKSIVRKVSNAYELLGLPEEKERVLEKYKDLFDKKISHNRPSKKLDQAKDSRLGSSVRCH